MDLLNQGSQKLQYLLCRLSCLYLPVDRLVLLDQDSQGCQQHLCHPAVRLVLRIQQVRLDLVVLAAPEVLEVLFDQAGPLVLVVQPVQPALGYHWPP